MMESSKVSSKFILFHVYRRSLWVAEATVEARGSRIWNGVAKLKTFSPPAVHWISIGLFFTLATTNRVRTHPCYLIRLLCRY